MSVHEALLFLPLPSFKGMMPLHQHDMLLAGSQAPLRGSFLFGMALHLLAACTVPSHRAATSMSIA